MDKWGLYEILKGNGVINSTTINQIKEMDIEDLKEGLIEFFISRNKHITE